MQSGKDLTEPKYGMSVSVYSNNILPSIESANANSTASKDLIKNVNGIIKNCNKFNDRRRSEPIHNQQKS